MSKMSKEIKRLKPRRAITTLKTQIKTAIKDHFDSQKPSKSVLLAEEIFDYVTTHVPPMALPNRDRSEPEDDPDIVNTTSTMSMAEKFLSDLIPHLAQPRDRGK